MRRDFLKEMKQGLFATLKTVYEPFVEDDLKKLEETTDRMLGIEWSFLCSDKQQQVEKLSQFYINGKPIIVIHEQGNIQAVSGVCPECSTLLHLTPLFSTCKCLNCEKEYNFQTRTGTLTFTELPITKKNNDYYVGIKK